MENTKAVLTDPTSATALNGLPPSLRGRRILFTALVVGTVLAVCGLMVATLSRGGFGLLDTILTFFFLITLPWTVIGFWNAVIGLVVLRLSRDPAGLACPVAKASPGDDPIEGKTALLSCIRNEDVEAVARNLSVMLEGLAAAGVADSFHLYVLSDSTWEDVITEEEAVLARLQDRWHGILPVTYRRREENPGFKAGNIRDFCERWGNLHDYALVLDADSMMSTDAVLRLVRTMQRNPRLGILQHLTVGMPTASPFARVFQFGMRLGMRSYTIGSAWWQGDCGPYWGHNALIRLQPFIEHCHLPQLPGRAPLGGWILSHDQVEAVLMRKAGFEVRVLPQEDGSWEENPPTLIEFVRRDLRWCQGNMQYWRLLAMPGLNPVSRAQLLLAILMFVGSPAWIAFMSLSMLRVGLADDPTEMFDPQLGLLLFTLIMTMVFAPKIATLLDVLASPAKRLAFGGVPRVLIGFVTEVFFSVLLAPVIALAHTRFLLGLFFGRAAVWSAQRRTGHRVTLLDGLKRLWLQTLFGASAFVWLGLAAPAALIGFLPFLLGSVLAVPIATITAEPRLGSLLGRLGLWRIPEETFPSADLRALQLPTLRPGRPAPAPAPAPTDTLAEAASRQ
jgi:membrane glycosyltransferase